MLATDPTLHAPELLPSLAGAALRMIVAVGLLAAAAWALMRWQKRGKAGRSRLQVLDRAFLSRGASVALIRVEGKRLLVGVSAEGVRLIDDLGRGEESLASRSFDRVLAGVANKRGAAQ